jgi:hypothetical protein
LGYELRRLTLSVVDNDTQLRRRYSHLTSQKRGDLAVNADSTDLQVLTNGSRPTSQFIIDVHLNAMVTGTGTWAGTFNSQTGEYDNYTLSQKELHKTAKHAQHYANIGFGFVPFVASCYGVFGQSASRLLMALASLELRQHDQLRSRNGLDPIVDESARSQFRSLCLRQSSARLGYALAKATVQRLLATPHLPVSDTLPNSALARNRPGPADFLPPSLPF